MRWVLIAATAVALAGCSNGGSTAASSGSHPSTPPASQPPTSQPPASRPDTGGGGGGTTVTAPAGVPDRLRQYCGTGPACDDFATPSGNIRCFGSAANGGFVECDIASGLVPKPNTSCELEQNGLVLPATGTAKLGCRGDPTPAGLDASIPALAYGSRWSGYGITCTSRRIGLSCPNGDGHGFFLSRERWQTS